LHCVGMPPPPFEMHLEEEDRSGSADLFNNLGARAVAQMWNTWFQFHRID